MRTHRTTQDDAREKLRRRAIKPPVEHVPGPCIAALWSVGHDVRRAKDEFEKGTEDGVLLEFATATDCVVLT